MAERRKFNIIVAGDVTVDWLQAYQGAYKDGQVWRLAKPARLYQQQGGAALLSDLLQIVLSNLPNMPNWELMRDFQRLEQYQNENPGAIHVHTLWSPFPYTSGASPIPEKHAWRMERFLGLYKEQARPRPHINGAIETSPSQAHLIVLEDANLGFRDRPEEWPNALNQHNAWIVVKMAHPVAQGCLWETLIGQHAERLVVITTAQDLRANAIQISKNISWERTAQDALWELTYNPVINSLSRIACLIVSFDCAGAILLMMDSRQHVTARLLFDPYGMEGDWIRAYPGDMMGYNTCLTAAVVRQILLNSDAPDFAQGIQTGIAAARLLHREGYGQRGSSPEQADLRFPLDAVAGEIGRQVQPLAETEIRNPAEFLISSVSEKPSAQSGYWTILGDRYTTSLEFIARQIVLEGYQSALSQVPVGRFGALVTVDRREIEALNGIQRLIREYCLTPQKKPLSIAVFGPPGAGKSFGIEQVARSVTGEIAVLSFNLSQFRSQDDLIDALHQVRDIGLTGKIPLVFWDEFDTSLDNQPLGWLRYFLAPMQDGAFQQGQIVHPIGRCIFVFAGSTSHTMEQFGNGLSTTEQRALKLPDFISRLKGFLNVLGPNPVGGPENDAYYVIRRALLLRSIFERNVPQIIHDHEGKKVVHIDDGLLRAFLLISQYKHGTRSMESLVSTSTLSGKSVYERSSLPPEDQLNLHVNASEFLSLMQQLELQGDILERMAQAAHEIFCENLRAQGYSYGTITDEKSKTHSSLRPYAELPEDEKEQNRLNVRDIPTKLALVGYRLRPARANEPPVHFSDVELELLARHEHERWMSAKLAAGWQYAPQTDKARKVHQSLLPWDELSEEEKEKDRLFVRGIPAILAKAGYTMEKIRS